MQLKVNNNNYTCEKVLIHIKDYTWDMRDNIEITLRMSYPDAVNLFVNDIQYGQILDDDSYVSFDEYSVAGPITDYRNGMLSVRMGKPTESEIKEAKILPIIQIALPQLDDATALTVADLYDDFNTLVEDGVTVDKGFRFQYNGTLYKVEQDGYTFNGVYAPGIGSESLFSKVAKDNEGTADTPIGYNNNMELIEDKYYEQGGIIYRCFRSTGVAVYNDLSALVGIYVELA